MTATPGQMLTLPSGSVWASEVHRHPCGALIVVWHHVGGPKDTAGMLAHTSARARKGLAELPTPPAPNPLGVAIVLGLALALIAFGLVLAFGDGNGWWAAACIGAGTVLVGRVLDVRERAR